MLNELINTIMAKDPAARSRLEVILCYPGFHAIVWHAFAHELYRKGHFLLARCISHLSRHCTGIEIHPGASLGRRLFIDHGMGTVIGETAIVGDDVVIYQGVSLGAGVEARMGVHARGIKRHPTLGNGVVVGSKSEIQGNITIGDNSRIASMTMVFKDVPPNCLVVGVPGRIIQQDGKRIIHEWAAGSSASPDPTGSGRATDKEPPEMQVSLRPGGDINANCEVQTEEDWADLFLHGGAI